MIRETVRSTVADGEIRKEFQVHLCFVREGKSCRRGQKFGSVGMKYGSLGTRHR